MPGWGGLLGNASSFDQNYQRSSLSIALLSVSRLFITDHLLPLFSLRDTELTCRFAGNMMLLSCDVMVATRLPKYIHARAGMEHGGQASPLGLAQR